MTEIVKYKQQQSKGYIESFSISSACLSHGIRLDASHYNPAVARVIKQLEESEMALDKLGNLVEDVRNCTL